MYECSAEHGQKAPSKENSAATVRKRRMLEVQRLKTGKGAGVPTHASIKAFVDFNLGIQRTPTVTGPHLWLKLLNLMVYNKSVTIANDSLSMYFDMHKLSVVILR